MQGDEMQGSLVFVHGTGVREGLQQTLDRVRKGTSRLGLPSESVSGPPWGQEIGPADLDVTPILPEPSAGTRTAAAFETHESSDTDVATWGLLVDDPLLELRILAVAPSEERGIVVDAQSAEVELQQRMDEAEVTQAALQAAGVTTEELRSAMTFIRDSDALIGAAQAVGDACDGELLEAVSRSVVACILHTQRTTAPPRLSSIAVSGDQRTQLVTALGDALFGAAARPLVTRNLWKAIGPLALRLGTAKGRENRAKFMDPFSDFIRDVAFYLRRGESVRSYLATAISALPSNGPVVVVGHSLGGIAMVDLLSGDNAPHVDLLVTVGSQSPYLYLLDSLESLRPGEDAKPFTPWLNIYSQADFLSFRVAPVFAGVDGIFDEEVDSGVPFPESHSAYWAHDETYDLIGEHWP
ncbi:hypothetical protein [Streptomyces sp. SP2-10]|uniref:hypothetical protein n=1 Tax=Streptomyces sp. SP2-10 TaxID=2873385 RepID=UPI001CA64BFF|nr:hypothetical protein [Streptomyces sp. SP2-10]MBY8847139.1 hypothetical protein [Streptomyces sp. SP2-10]